MIRPALVLVAALALAGCATSGEPAEAPPATGFSMADAVASGTSPTAPLPTFLSPLPPPGPVDTFGPGTYVVGTDILPGTYRTTGPAREGGFCYWMRLKDTTGDPGAFITNGGGEGPATATIKESDGAFTTSGCAQWTNVG